MKRVLITGASGLVGSKFVELYKNKYNLITPVFPEFDITNVSQVGTIFEETKPDVVINFAAFTDVNMAEDQRNNKNGSCWKINRDAVNNIVSMLPKDTHLIHISTDMVFPGSIEFSGPYTEDQVPESDPNKLTWYGFSKAEGERIIKDHFNNNMTILRLIYPFSANYNIKIDYVRKPISLFDQGKLYPMFMDQQISVVLVDKIAEALEIIIDDHKDGVFHASSEDMTTPYELVQYILEKTRGAKNIVQPSSLDDFLKSKNNSVRYPKYGGLSVIKTEKILGIKFGTWKEMIDEFTIQIK